MDASIASLNRSTFEERQKNISYLRNLYFLFALQLVIAVVWSAWNYTWFPNWGAWIIRNWGVALAAGILCALLLLFAFFSSASRQSPVNWAVYFLFTIGFAIVWSYLVVRDGQNRYVWYVLWLLTAMAIGFAVYACAVLIILGSTLIVFFLFLVFTKITLMWLILLLVPVIVFGFYLNYDIRKMVRGNMFDHVAEDAVSGAVRIWLESAFVFCRFVELVGGMFSKSKH